MSYLLFVLFTIFDVILLFINIPLIIMNYDYRNYLTEYCEVFNRFYYKLLAKKKFYNDSFLNYKTIKSLNIVISLTVIVLYISQIYIMYIKEETYQDMIKIFAVLFPIFILQLIVNNQLAKNLKNFINKNANHDVLKEIDETIYDVTTYPLTQYEYLYKSHFYNEHPLIHNFFNLIIKIQKFIDF